VTADPHRDYARDVFRELLEIDTTDATGDVTRAAEAMAARLRDAGVPADDVLLLGPHAKKRNLVARLRGSGARQPLLLLAHLDVVDAPCEHWTVEPFALTEQDGHYYGRGTTDDKAMAAIWVATLARLAADRVPLDRDVVLALTADEEGGAHNGVQWLLANHPDLVRAAYGLNEGGYGRVRQGRRLSNQVQAGEKTPVFFELVAHGTGGHSSLPPADSAITRLADALRRVADLRMPLAPSEVTRAFFARMAESETGALADDMRALGDPASGAEVAERLARVPYFAGLLRTTCVATRVEAGVGDNVLPQSARAVLDCRLLPGTAVDDVRRRLVEAIGDERVSVRPLTDVAPAPPSPLLPELMDAVERITAELWPGVPVIPSISVGATDSAHFRRAGTPMYGVSGLFLDVDDTRAHGPDERVGVEAFHESQEFLHRLARSLAAADRS
jgi:acetylornithine deacetylase/succinyl-diaminopimelate desuccinylase-like protein